MQQNKFFDWVCPVQLCAPNNLVRHLKKRNVTGPIGTLLDLIDVAAVGTKTLNYALSMDWREFEDAGTAAAAVRAGATHLITRIIHDFKPLPIPVVTRNEFLATTK